MGGRAVRVRVEVYPWHSYFLFLSPSYLCSVHHKGFCCCLHLFFRFKAYSIFYTYKALDIFSVFLVLADVPLYSSIYTFFSFCQLFRLIKTAHVCMFIKATTETLREKYVKIRHKIILLS